jgi:hypothetical protein
MKEMMQLLKENENSNINLTNEEKNKKRKKMKEIQQCTTMHQPASIEAKNTSQKLKMNVGN